MDLLTFLSRIDQRLDASVSNDVFHPAQREMLLKNTRQYRSLALSNPHFDPLSRSLFYFIVRAWGRRIDEEVESVVTFLAFYLLSADLLDDVQDDDLAGKPYAALGPAFASNDALAMLFLGIGALHRSLETQPSLSLVEQRLRLFQRTAILATAGQHRDLMGAAAAQSPEDVLAVLSARNSSLSMILGYAAALSGCGEENAARYQRIGEKLALFVQIPGDLRDILGKTISPDLATGKITYPIACFHRDATPQQRQRLAGLVPAMPNSIREIRELFYAAGVVEACAATMEELRQDIHVEVAATGNFCAEHRCLLGVVDGLAGAVYEPPDVPSSLRFFEPDGNWHAAVRRSLAEFAARMPIARARELPRLCPWHLPQWMYLPKKQLIYYPDIEGLADEILPVQALIVGTTNVNDVQELMRVQIPAVLAHEMFHFLRHASGRMTGDHWHEEWVANRLAVAYLNRFAPEVLAVSLQLALGVLAKHSQLLNDRVAKVLDRCHDCCPDSREGYDMDVMSMAIVSMAMIRRLAAQPSDLDEAVTELLSEPAHPAETWHF